jgi:MoxR-like ATPase
MNLQGRIQEIADALERHKLHLGQKDLVVGDRRMNSATAFCMANACLKNRAVLLYGGMGANKTTLVNLLGSAFTGRPFEEIENLMISGHPEQTEEKIIGFIDPRQWTNPSCGSNAGFDVIWTEWAGSRWKVINELNRFPGGKQNIFLELLLKRKLYYAGQVQSPGDTCYFATMNPEFSATYPVDEALMDRISACVPAIQPDLISSLSLAGRDKEVRELAENMPRLNLTEFDRLKDEVETIKLGPDVELAIVSLIRDLTLCERAPFYDKTQLSAALPSKGLCSGCHYMNNPELCCWQTDEGLSDRARQDLRSFTKAIAYVSGYRGPLMPALKAVAPYVLWHRLTPNRAMLQKPPYYGAGRFAFVADLVESSINRTANERAAMNRIFSMAVDGDMDKRSAIAELSSFDDPIARLDYVPALERMA